METVKNIALLTISYGFPLVCMIILLKKRFAKEKKVKVLSKRKDSLARWVDPLSRVRHKTVCVIRFDIEGRHVDLYAGEAFYDTLHPGDRGILTYAADRVAKFQKNNH